MIIFSYALKESLKTPINLLMIFLIPLAVLFIPANAYSFPQGIYLVGMAILYSGFLVSRPMVEDRMRGIITRIYASPVKQVHYLISHLAAYFLLLMAQSLVFILGAWIRHGTNVFHHGWIYLLYLSFGLMCLALTLTFTSFFKNFGLAFGIFSGLGSLMSLLGGVSIPLHMMPEEILPFIRILPTYWLPFGLDALYEGVFIEYFLAHVILWVYTGIFIAIGSRRRI